MLAHSNTKHVASKLSINIIGEEVRSLLLERHHERTSTTASKVMKIVGFVDLVEFRLENALFHHCILSYLGRRSLQGDLVRVSISF